MQASTQPEYTLADLTRITGAKRRSVQLWAEAGVIRAMPSTERAGTGTHRRFSRREAIVACIVHAFAKQQMAIGALLRISRAARSWAGDAPDEVEAAIKDTRKVFMVYQSSDNSWIASVMQQIPRSLYVNLPVSAVAGKGGFAATILLNNYLAGLR